MAAREKETCKSASTCEDWTVIVVTDHGHQPQQGFGHGFQSPDETTTFVIADGPQFGDGVFNPDYEIVDVTPTVLNLFGAPQGNKLDGVPLTSLRGSDSDPLSQVQLHDTLKAQMASNDYPNIIVNVALSLRTIVAFVPNYLYGADLPAPLGDILYVATNVPAQVVAFVTGVHGVQPLPAVAAAATTDHAHTGRGNIDRCRVPRGLRRPQSRCSGMCSELIAAIQRHSAPACTFVRESVTIGRQASYEVKDQQDQRDDRDGHQ